MPAHPEYDAVVIGAGSGGLTAAVGLAHFGKRVALIERHHIGGDCTNVGCIPSKSLLHLTRGLDGTGSAEASRPFLERVRQRRDQLRLAEEVEFGSTEHLTLIPGAASFVGPGRVRVSSADGEVVYHADHVVIATGSRPRRLGLAGDRSITNEELFELEVRPDRLAIVGAGPVGLEMALAFARLGSEITVIEQGEQVAPGALRDAATVLQRRLEAVGVQFILGAKADTSLPAVAGADKVLEAVGRQPNVEGLGLVELGVDLDEAGRIVVDSRGRTSVRGIWATGDVANRTGTTHGANAWGRRIIKSIVARPLPIGDEPVEPSVVYTDPELAIIGAQSVDPAPDVRRIVFALPDADRGYTDELDDGLVIVDVRRLTGVITGATIVGPRAGELISVFALAMHVGIPLHKWYGTVWPYPSYADALGRVVDLYMTDALDSIPKDALGWARGRLSGLFSRPGR